MELNGNKCVMVIDEAMPLGIIANTAGIMGLTLGKHIPETIGPEVLDMSGRAHLGIIQIPVPILKADSDKIKEIRQRFTSRNLPACWWPIFPTWRRAAMRMTITSGRPPW